MLLTHRELESDETVGKTGGTALVTLGIMQPYFFPYLGYFDLINKSDTWIVFDTPQYIRHGWVNRNRILHPTTGWQYVNVPIKKSGRDTPIHEIEISYQNNWKEKILGQLMHYNKKAPFYRDTVELIRSCFDHHVESLSALNVLILKAVCEKLGIDFNYAVFSQMDLEIGEVTKPGDWALRISEALGAQTYINPPGGECIFDKAAFQSSNIQLRIQKFENMTYPTPRYEFTPGLSIIDVLMWNEVEAIRQYLNSH